MNCNADWLDIIPPSRVNKTALEIGSLGESVTSMAAHPKHDLVLIGTAGGKVVAWDPTQAKMTHSLEAHRMDVTRVNFAPDGKRFLTASLDGSVAIWDHQFKLIQRYECESPLYDVSLSPDGAHVAAGGEDTIVRVWDRETGVILHELKQHQDVVSACAWITNKQLASGGGEGYLLAWEVEERRTVRAIRAHQERISRIILAPGGNWYVTASWDKSVKVFNLYHKEKFTYPPGSQAIMSMSLADDGELLVAAGWDGSVTLYKHGKLFDEFTAYEASLVGCDLIAGSQFLVTINQEGTLRSWNLNEMGTSRFVNQHAGEVYSVHYTPDNVYLLTAGHDGQLKVWDRNTRGESSYIECQTGPVVSCAVSPDNRYWAIGTAEGHMKIWDVDEQAFEISLRVHNDNVSALAFHPNGNMLVTGSWDMKLKLWSLQTQFIEGTFDGHSKEVAACDITLDGRKMASASWDGTARIWDLIRVGQVNKELMVLSGHTERVMCCAFSPNGSELATGSADQTVRLWNVDRIEEPRVLFGHANAVTCCRFTPDGQLLVTADRDGNVLLWHAESGRALGSLQHDNPILTLAIAPDGVQGAIGDEYGNVAFFELEYELGPNWVATATILKPPPLWKRGSPPTELFEVTCVYCGHNEGVQKKQLGGLWRCPKCTSALMLCPRGTPPQPV